MPASPLPPTHVAYRASFSSALVPRCVPLTVTATNALALISSSSWTRMVSLLLTVLHSSRHFFGSDFRSISRPATALLRIHPRNAPARLSAPLFDIACFVPTTTTTVASPSPPIHRDRHRPLFFATIDILTRRRPLRWFNTQQKDGSYQADSPKVHGW